MSKRYDEFIEWAADQPLFLAFLFAMTAQGIVLFVLIGLHFLATEQYNGFIGFTVIPFLLWLLIRPRGVKEA